MSYSPAQKYPGATESDPNYQDTKFKDNNPSTTNNGSPLKAIDRNELLAMQEAVMNEAGFEYNGLPDTPQDSQMFKAYKAALGNGANLLSNHNFLTQRAGHTQPPPSSTPTSYPPGYELFQGVFANESTGITNLTYIDDRVSFSGGDLYFSVPNSNGIEKLTVFAASVADFDGKPRQMPNSSWSLVGDNYRVTVGVVDLTGGPLGSVKFEQGSVATGHEVEYGVVATGSTTSRSLSDRFADVVNVKDFGAVGDGVTDDTAAIQAALDTGRVVDLAEQGYLISATLNVPKGIRNGKILTNSVFDRVLIATGVDPIFEDLVLDHSYLEVKRSIEITENLGAPRVVNVTVRNVHSTTFHRSIYIDTQGNKGLLIENCKGYRLHVDPDGVVGNANGSCRFILVGNDKGLTVTNNSAGLINNTYVEDLLPKEDGDAIQVQSLTGGTLSHAIQINNTVGVNVAKRIIKIQASSIQVTNVHADARENATNMYSIVSMYGAGNTLTGVTGIGDFDNGVDIKGSGNTLTNVNIYSNLNSTPVSIIESSAILHNGGDDCVYTNIRVQNFNIGVHIRGILQATSNIVIGDVVVSGARSQALRVDDGTFAVGDIRIDNCDFESVNDSRQCIHVSFDNTANFRMSDTVVKGSGYFTVVEIEPSGGNVTLDNITISATGGSATGVYVLSGDYTISNIETRDFVGTPVFVQSNGLINGVRAKNAGTRCVLLDGTAVNNTIVNNIYCNQSTINFVQENNGAAGNIIGDQLYKFN